MERNGPSSAGGYWAGPSIIRGGLVGNTVRHGAVGARDVVSTASLGPNGGDACMGALSDCAGLELALVLARRVGGAKPLRSAALRAIDGTARSALC